MFKVGAQGNSRTHKHEFDSVSWIFKIAQEAKMEIQTKFEYTRNHHSIGDSIWHMEWCPKYRYQMFRKFKYKNLIAACIRKAATEYCIKILILNVMPDHLHTVIKLPLTMTPSKALQLLKGKSAYLFFRVHPKARLRYPKGHLWSRGKFATSIGYSDLPTTLRYVLNQENHHA